MPPFIAYGFACGVHLPLTLGIKVVIVPNLDPNKLGSLIWKYKPEHMFGVPSHYQQLAVDPKLQNKDLSFIRNYAAGGDAIAGVPSRRSTTSWPLTMWNSPSPRATA